jgi:hypothetical protein
VCANQHTCELLIAWLVASALTYRYGASWGVLSPSVWVMEVCVSTFIIRGHNNPSDNANVMSNYTYNQQASTTHESTENSQTRQLYASCPSCFAMSVHNILNTMGQRNKQQQTATTQCAIDISNKQSAWSAATKQASALTYPYGASWGVLSPSVWVMEVCVSRLIIRGHNNQNYNATNLFNTPRHRFDKKRSLCAGDNPT